MFTALAYTGVPMRIKGFRHPVILNMSGMNPRRPDVPALRDHDDGRIVGHVTGSEVTGNGVLVEGVISGGGADAEEVIRASRNGFVWQVSLGSNPLTAMRLLAKGKKETINGQTITGPVFVADESEFSELSFVARGADGNTSAAIAAKEKRMGNDTLQDIQHDGASTERDRIERIEATCNSLQSSVDEGKLGELRIQAIAGEIDENEFNQQLLESVANKAELNAIRNRRTSPIATGDSQEISYGHDGIIQAALLTRAGYGEVAEKDFGERVMEKSKQLHSASLIDIIRASYQAVGLTPPRDRNELIRSAFSKEGQISAGGSSMYSLPTTLGNAMGRVLETTYRETASTWRKFCAVRSVSSFHDHTSIRPSYVGEMEQVGKDGDLKSGSLDESYFNYSVDTFGKVLKVNRKDIVNDNLGFLDEVAPAYGRMAARGLADLVISTLLSAGSSHFDASLGNTGVSALSVASLEAAIIAMQKQRDDQNNDIDIQPAWLIVPPELGPTAKTALQSEYTEQVAENTAAEVNTVRPTGNPLRNSLKYEVESRLSNTEKFTNADLNNWYLFGKPSDIPMVVAFLEGKQTPTIDFFGFDSGPTSLAATWRIYHDYGAALGDYRAAYKSNVA